MITNEPKIKAAILQNYSEAEIVLNGNFRLSDGFFLRGKIVAKGTPEDVARNEKSYTGKYLKRKLKKG